ncbi:juvenile hormone esterase-like isoform X2 [Aethina tumida]|uniref:juvenile hormone esterase-like isoform X2 n=1 Tax=Aethina tumida TaxID=116153 RepID=UPI002148D48A|nr:juvenile hormone esterase-like isoform X2 [Aethina tumida]
MPSLKLVIISCVLYSVIADDPILELPNGKIKGKVITTRAGVDFYSYTQIPFAKPPVGDLRFKAPEPAEKWDGTLDCTQSTKFCYNIGSSDESQTEDCLYLNVYVPVNGTGNMPVMYHIFGGGFVQGNALFESNGPHYFMEYGVIVVTVNYRVGSFGFLSTGNTVIPGNFGLKDQNLGLKWVRDNIHYFGGDPSKVTVFGLSAGGASTTFHIISKQSQGLFRAAFAESGSALNPWAYQRYANKIAYQLATLIDPNFNESSTSEKLLSFLQTVPAKDLNAASNNVNVGYIDEMAQGFHFAPVVEPEHDDAFITETAYESLESGNINKVPLIIGMTSEEGLYRLNNGYYQTNTQHT